MTAKDPNDSVLNEHNDSGIENSGLPDEAMKNAPGDDKTPEKNYNENVTGEEETYSGSKHDIVDADETVSEGGPDKEKDEEVKIAEESDSLASVVNNDDKDTEESHNPGPQVNNENQAAELPEVDYSGHSREKLVETLDLLIENRPPNEIRDDVEKIKSLFYRKYRQEADELKKTFLAEGGSEEDFTPPADQLESIMKRMLSRYRSRKTEYNKQFEIEKQENLKRKYDIIEKIKDLVNREESINKTFQDFRELQNEWYALGPVPQSALKNLWETYNYNVEIFYDYIKINKELRDLDFKKNFELKLAICEKADILIDDPNPVAAFRVLQEYHQRWREIGPVPREERDNLWERFKEATSKINKRHHEFFEKQKDDQKKNLELKTELCEQIEKINIEQIAGFKEWEEKAREVIELQNKWRTIGFAPKKYNNEIYARFRESCDKFFQEKRKFYAENKEVQLQNLRLKTELCEKAEEMQTSTDWKNTTNEFIALQKKWKQIGSVPRKNSDKIWKRFRKACDAFFDAKSEYFSSVDNSFENNLKLKIDLIEKLENFDPSGDSEEAFEELKQIQEEWNSIGFVPFKNKDEIANRYRSALNRQFDKLNLEDDEKAIIRYRSKLDNLKDKPNISRKLRNERERFVNRIKQLESDIVTWENNIGFFSKSSNAESMIKEVEEKIENARKTLEMLKEKVRMIDRSGLDE